MFAYLSIAFFIVAAGYFTVPGESAVSLQKDHQVVITKTATDDENSFCREFPQHECFDNGVPDELKTEVEIFKQEFCPSHKSLNCVEEFTQRCLPTDLGQKLKMKFFNRSKVVLNLELCKSGPYEKDTLKHLNCLHSAKFMYIPDCPFGKNPALKNFYQYQPGLAFEDYGRCVLSKVWVMCGSEAQLFVKDYLKPWNISAPLDESIDNYLEAFKL